MDAWKNTTGDPPVRGVVGRPSASQVYDLQRWEPSGETARFVEHFWSVTWDLCGQEPFESTVITFPSMHITHEWGEDGERHGYPLPNTLMQGVVEQVFRTTISARGAVVGARFRPGGFTARFGVDASTMTGRVLPVDDTLFGRPVHLDDDVISAAEQLDGLIGSAGEPTRPTWH